MKIKYLQVLFIFTIVFTSCNNNCIQTHLTNDERDWFLRYRKGDVIIFKSNLGNLDSLKVVSKTEGFTNPDCNRIGVGKYQQEFIKIEFEPNVYKNIDIYNVAEISIYKDYPDKIDFPFFRIFGLEYADIIENHNLIREKITLSTTNKTYFVYSFKENVNTTNAGNEYLKSFQWDKKEGLIRYEANNGEIFELLKKLKL